MKNKQGISAGSHSSSELFMDQNIDTDGASPTNLTQDVIKREVLKFENLVDILKISKTEIKNKNIKNNPQIPFKKDFMKPRKSILVINNQQKITK